MKTSHITFHQRRGKTNSKTFAKVTYLMGSKASSSVGSILRPPCSLGSSARKSTKVTGEIILDVSTFGEMMKKLQGSLKAKNKSLVYLIDYEFQFQKFFI